VTAPVLRLIRGSATAEELAAVVALLASRSGAPEPEPEPVRRSLWATPQLRPPLSHGPGAWRASGLPR
jgi:hypothetical protein